MNKLRIEKLWKYIIENFMGIYDSIKEKINDEEKFL